MSYSDTEALWLTRIRALSQFDGNNSSRGKFGMLNTGKSAQYAILSPGEQTRERYGLGGTRLNHYQTIIRVYQRYTEDGTSMIDLEQLTDAIMDDIDKYPYIGDSTNEVRDAQILQAGAVLGYPNPIQPEWLIVEMIGACDEETEISFAE